MAFNKENFIIEAAKEVERVDQLKRKARQEGKKSKATINFNKFGKKYGLNPEGYTFLDMFFGQIIMLQMGEMFTDEKAMTYQELANRAFEQTKHRLESELSMVI